jgi:two-component sensor histidine kinase
MPFRNKITRNNDLFYNIVLLSSGIGVVVHFGVLFYFFFTGVHELILYNIISILFFVTCFILVLKGKSVPTIFLFISAEVIAHALLAVKFVGYNSGFSFFIFTLPTIHLLYDKWSLKMNVTYFTVLTITFLSIYYLDFFSTSIYQLSETLLSITKVTCALFTEAIILLILFTFRKLVFKNELELKNTSAALEKKTTEVFKELNEKKILLKEIHHRVKNNLQLISSLINLQKNKTSDKNTIRVLSDSSNRIHAMALAHKKLYEEKDLSVMDFYPYLVDLIQSQQNINYPIHFELNATNVLLELDTAVPLSLITNELVTNAFKHAFHEGRDNHLTIILTEEEHDIFVLSIADNGPGLSSSFNLQSNESLGMEIVNALSTQINATIHYKTGPSGTEFSLNFKKK